MIHARTWIRFLILISLFWSKFSTCTCHLKDFGERNNNLTVMMDEFESRILNGEEANLEDYPFIVQFFNFGGMCGGSILTGKIVLTAAHCFDHNKNIAEMKIVANALYRFKRNMRSHEVWEFIIHEFYNIPYKYSNDIALIIIRDRFVFGSTVQKVVLSKSSRWMTENETNFVAMGWGITEWRRGILRETRLRYVSPWNCSMMSGLLISKDMFCLFGDEKTDTCYGDSGGGVLWRGLLVGIVSHGRGCLHTPSVYVNINYFKHWIRRTVNKMYLRYCSFHSLPEK